MKNKSVLSCEHIHIHRIPGRTDAILSALQGYLRTLFQLLNHLGSAEILIDLDGAQSRFEWLDDVCPASDEGCIDRLTQADEIDVRVDMCCDQFPMEDAQKAISALLKDGSLKDCARYCALIEDDQTSSLTLSGLYRGAFLHGSVPFTSNNEDILVDTQWNGSSHRAEFQLRPESEEQARDLVELLESHLDIELNLSDDGRSLVIDGVQLGGRHDVRFYRETLEKLVRLSDRALITGSLIPESDNVFALLRFVQEGSLVNVQTAVAEA